MGTVNTVTNYSRISGKNVYVIVIYTPQSISADSNIPDTRVKSRENKFAGRTLNKTHYFNYLFVSLTIITRH